MLTATIERRRFLFGTENVALIAFLCGRRQRDGRYIAVNDNHRHARSIGKEV